MKIESGFYTIEACAGICYIRVYSSWDKTVVQAYHAHLRKISALYSGRKWGGIVDLREWHLNTPDAEKEVTRAIKENPLACPPSHMAFINGGSEIKQWQIKKSLPDPESGLNQFFDTVKQGEDWLISLGYDTSSHPLESDDIYSKPHQRCERMTS